MDEKDKKGKEKLEKESIMAKKKDSADEVVFVHGLTPCPYSVNRADSAWRKRFLLFETRNRKPDSALKDQSILFKCFDFVEIDDASGIALVIDPFIEKRFDFV